MSNRKNQKGEITWQQNYYAYGIIVMPGAAKDYARITDIGGWHNNPFTFLFHFVGSHIGVIMD